MLKQKTTSFVIAIIAGGIFCNVAFGNGGVGVGTNLVLGHNQYPAAIKRYNPSEVHILYWGAYFNRKDLQGSILRDDTIINYKKFTESYTNITGIRLIYSSGGKTDSVVELDSRMRISIKAYNIGNDMLHILSFDSTMQKTDEFVFNWGGKNLSVQNTRGKEEGGGLTTLEQVLRKYKIYDSFDRSNYAAASVWILSVGIDDYGPTKYRTCKRDALSYTAFFKQQFSGSIKGSFLDILFHEYVLLDQDATKEAILSALKDIARRASFNDYFIFNFNGCSNVFKNDAGKDVTTFFPYDVILTQGSDALKNRSTGDTADAIKKCISLKLLQEHIQAIPANNQLFISEAGPSEKFRTEFIKTLMQNSPEVASILNKNRVIIVPNGIGLDGFRCQGNSVINGPINYFITSLDSGNIYDLFKEEYVANQVAFRIKNKAWNCKSFNREYFDIFFEQKFLREYREIFQDEAGQTRGAGTQSTELRKTANLEGKQYALVVGTDNYRSAGWKKLPNAIHDARAVSDELVKGYGFEVQLLEDKPLDTIYKALGEYYRMLQPSDQLVIYFAGHGDMETEFMDDGFIVCTDSKSRNDDPTRNTYIQYIKLQKMINKIPARQILVMLDVCHGGVFNQKRSDPVKAISNRNVRQFLADQSQFTCRKFLSSVGTEEAFDGKPGEHSPFANLLLQVLRARGNNSNGIVTLSGIFSVLQTASMNETATLKISPQKDGFGKDNPESDFILIPVEQKNIKE